MKWAKRFMEIAATVASWSKDSTKVGAVAVNDARHIAGTGYNGPARGVRDDIPMRWERPEAYLWMAHAEENLVAEAARQVLEGATVYVTHKPCARCARMLAQAGVARVVFGDGKTSMHPREFEVADQIFDEAGVDFCCAPTEST